MEFDINVFTKEHKEEKGVHQFSIKGIAEAAEKEWSVKLTQEDYYQIITEQIDHPSHYLDFLRYCLTYSPENHLEQLARKEFIENWHEEYKKGTTLKVR